MKNWESTFCNHNTFLWRGALVGRWLRTFSLASLVAGSITSSCNMISGRTCGWRQFNPRTNTDKWMPRPSAQNFRSCNRHTNHSFSLCHSHTFLKWNFRILLQSVQITLALFQVAYCWHSFSFFDQILLRGSQVLFAGVFRDNRYDRPTVSLPETFMDTS